jgi:GTP cyclohydrolase I
MKLNGESTLKQAGALVDNEQKNHLHIIENDHHFNGIETPMREDAFELDDESKVDMIEEQFRRIMTVLGLDLTDDSLRNTPRRVAKMFVKEIFKGLDTEDVAVFIESTHFCVTMRGVEDDHSSTITTSFHGKFKSDQRRNEFLNLVR